MLEIRDSYDGPATIVQRGGRFPVSCSYQVFQEMVPAGDELLPGLFEWRGTFDVVEGFVELDTATLERADGRSGEILVNELEGFSDRGAFVGNGDPP